MAVFHRSSRTDSVVRKAYQHKATNLLEYYYSNFSRFDEIVHGECFVRVQHVQYIFVAMQESLLRETLSLYGYGYGHLSKARSILKDGWKLY